MELTHFIRKMQRQDQAVAAIKTLEQRHQLNSSILWYAMWYAQAPYGRLRKIQLQTLQQTQQPWHDKIFIALRDLQKSLSGAPHRKALRIRSWIMEEMIRAQEMEQDFLQQCLGSMKIIHRSAAQQLLDACHNVVQYFRLQQLNWDETDREMMNIIFCAVFPNSPAALIRQQLIDAITRIQISAPGYEQLSLI